MDGYVEFLPIGKGLNPRLPAMQEIQTSGRPSKACMLCKRDSYVVVAQLSPELTARLVDRWQELENKNILVLPDFSNPAIP